MKKDARSIWSRVLAGLLSILMVLTLAACAGNGNTPAANEKPAPSENTDAAEGENNGNAAEASGEKETLRVMIWETQRCTIRFPMRSRRIIQNSSTNMTSR